MSRASFTLPAFAKINWTLHILGRRADGLHELETILQTVSLCDLLTFDEGAGDHLELTASGEEEVPQDETNLILRAARALREKYDLPDRGARLHVEKHIPLGGGLGGGSANAAVTLLGLTRLWGIEAPPGALAEIGATLGADVPFFLTGGTALGLGTGTEIHPLTDARAPHLLLIAPGVKVSTAQAYAGLHAPALTKGREDIKLTVSRAESQISDLCGGSRRNDFEPTVFAAAPEIERAREALLGAGALCASMTGSGASVFGVFDNEIAQERARAALGRHWRVIVCAAIGREQYRRALSGSPAGSGTSWGVAKW